ncbi:MAG: hypothetical protein NTY74_14260 [Ignavibacteriae bacterium]|nr:hypothetical protein [Ignavibacteriota bacterium]
MKKLLIICLLINASVLFSQTNSVEKIKSAGVKSLVTKSYSFENDKKYVLETKKFDFDSTGKVIKVNFDSPGYFDKIAYIYDLKGKDIEEKMYNSSKVVRSYKFEYNNSGKKIYSKSINNADDVDMEVNYTYDEKGNLLQEESISGNRKFGFKYTYDKSSRKTEMVFYNPTKLEKKFYYKYDDKGLLIEERGFLYWAGSQKAKYNDYSRRSFYYNDNKEMTGMDYYISDVLFEKYLYFYNDNGLLTKWERYSTNDKLLYSVEYEYE